MNASIYLNRIALRQFRSFEELDIELAPRPGVFVVHGSNGLGKSSLFNAIEWALSGEIDQFKSVKGFKKIGSYLCRWRDDRPGPTSVTLGFSEGTVIERTLASATAVRSDLGGSTSDITSFLRAPDWAQSISALERYLSLTHFLGQTTATRLSHRADDRFDVLKEAARSDQIEAIADAMHGKGNTSAVRAFNRRIESLEQDAKTLRDLLDQEEQLWEGAQISGALDEPECLALAERVGELALRAMPSSTALPGISLSAAGLDALQTYLDRAVDAQRRHSTSIELARRLVDATGRHGAALAEATAMLEGSDSELRESDAILSSALEDVGSKEAAVAEAQRDFAKARAHLSQLLELSSALARAKSLRTAQEYAQMRHLEAEKAFADAQVALIGFERRGQIIARLTAQIAAADEDLAVAYDFEMKLNECIESEKSIREGEIELQRIESENPAIEAAVKAAEEAVMVARNNADIQFARTEAMEATVSAISAAVSEIASHLTDDVCDCPVCGTRFDQASVLRSHASAAANRVAPRLLDQQQVLRASQAALTEAIARFDELGETHGAIQQLRTMIAVESRLRRAHIERLNLPLDGPNDKETQSLQANVTDRIARIERRRARQLRWREALARDATDDATTLSQAIRKRDEAHRIRDAAARDLLDTTSQLKTEASTAEASGRLLLDSTSPSDEAVRLAIETSEFRLGGIQEALTRRSEELESARARVSLLSNTKAASVARREQINDALAYTNAAQLAVRTQWAQLPWGDSPIVSETVDEVAAESTKALLAVREAEDLLRRLRLGREAWLRQQNHRSSLDRLRMAIDVPPNVGRPELRFEAQIIAALKQAEAASSRDAKKIAYAASADIYDELESFNTDYIEPLDKLTKQINQAILCDPDAGIDLQVRDRRIEQSVSRSGSVPANIGDLDPTLIHSEGQMAAISVSMLCAASLTYPWSRWRALVLDDPLQHNDAIHAAAFADLMGNLVVDRGYQILISTHDMAQAQFLQRKFDSRNISCAVLRLIGQGRSGVQTEFQLSQRDSQSIATVPGSLQQRQPLSGTP